MLALIENSPDIYLELQEQLPEQHDVKIIMFSILRTLKRLGMSLKKVRFIFSVHQITFDVNACECLLFSHLQLSCAAAERCKEARQDFALNVGQYPPECLVTADEAAVNILTTYC